MSFRPRITQQVAHLPRAPGADPRTSDQQGLAEEGQRPRGKKRRRKKGGAAQASGSSRGPTTPADKFSAEFGGLASLLDDPRLADLFGSAWDAVEKEDAQVREAARPTLDVSEIRTGRREPRRIAGEDLRRVRPMDRRDGSLFNNGGGDLKTLLANNFIRSGMARDARRANG